MGHIVKRAGRTEPYDVRKLYASVYSACLSVREHPGAAELIAYHPVPQWITGMAFAELKSAA